MDATMEGRTMSKRDFALREALDAIMQAATVYTRDRFNRPISVRDYEPLRRLMCKYGAPDGGNDAYDQIAFVARAVLDLKL
jgi:hypothetical protein